MSAAIACLIGIAPWKRRRIQSLLGITDVPFARNSQQAVEIAKRDGGAIACWATRVNEGLDRLADEANIPLWRIEDGFIRSKGLGAALHRPASIVLDKSGIYYDPSKPSDLENILSQRQFSDQESVRAQAIVDKLHHTHVTKYNLDGCKTNLPGDRKIALVIGQVADDASMQLGAAGLTTEQLITRVRQIEPDAFLVYKPHPDVVVGLRDGLVQSSADLTLPNDDLLWLIDRADSVHVLTSLAGFEALIRGKPVHVHGQPFYAGWGLTVDYNPVERRKRHLTVAELVAGTLISYPVYCHPETGEPIEVEQLIDALALAKAPGQGRELMRNWAGKAAQSIGRLKVK
jgi:capsule polysaccharide export protein KpsC/LpsZ